MDIFVNGGMGYMGTRLLATIQRPSHVLRRGRWWPVALAPLDAIAEVLPSPRHRARRLGLVSVAQRVRAPTRAVETPPPAGTRRNVEVPEIRSAAAT